MPELKKLRSEFETEVADLSQAVLGVNALKVEMGEE